MGLTQHCLHTWRTRDVKWFHWNYTDFFMMGMASAFCFNLNPSLPEKNPSILQLNIHFCFGRPLGATSCLTKLMKMWEEWGGFLYLQMIRHQLLLSCRLWDIKNVSFTEWVRWWAESHTRHGLLWITMLFIVSVSNNCILSKWNRD